MLIRLNQFDKIRLAIKKTYYKNKKKKKNLCLLQFKGRNYKKNILFKTSFIPYVEMYVPNQYELVINDK